MYTPSAQLHASKQPDYGNLAPSPTHLSLKMIFPLADAQAEG
jgi:hypothetical protein